MTGSPASSPDVSIVIVTFNAREFLLKCLATVPAATRQVSAEVLVVDNGGGDGTWDALASCDGVRALRGSRSLGYAGGNNLAWRRACGRHVLFLNPDTELTPGSIDALVARLESDDSVGIVGPRLVLPDGSLDPAARRTIPTPLSAALRLLRLARVIPFGRRLAYNLPVSVSDDPRVEAVSGACMLVRGETFRALRGFDAGYFMYGEDLDLAARARRQGWSTVYSPDVTVLHLKRRSSRQRDLRTRFEFYRAMWRFYHRHRRSDPAVVRLAVSTAVLILGAGALLLRLTRRLLADG